MKMEDNSAKRTNDCAVYKILSYLDAKTLITACQVTKSWNTIISKNQRLWRNVCSWNGFLVPAEPSEEQLADATYSKHLCLKTAATVERLIKEWPWETITLRNDEIGFMAEFFYNGKYATTSRDLTVRIWSCATGECLANYSMHSDVIYDMKFDDNFIVTASLDRTAACWDASNGTRLQTFVHTEKVWCVDFNTIIDVLVTTSNDRNVRIWSFTDGNLLRTMVFKSENTGDLSAAASVKIWGMRDSFFHILAWNEEAVLDYEIGSNMTVVEKKDVFIERGNLLFSGCHVDDSSVKVWVEETDSSSGSRTLSETCFGCVNSCGRNLLTRRPITRIVRLPYTTLPVAYLTSGACFDVFFVCNQGDDPGRLYVTRCNSETRHFTINLPQSAGHDFICGVSICETQWLDGLSEESLCHGTLVAVHNPEHDVELLKLKPLK